MGIFVVSMLVKSMLVKSSKSAFPIAHTGTAWSNASESRWPIICSGILPSLPSPQMTPIAPAETIASTRRWKSSR